MFIKRNQHLRALERVRIPETRDLERGLRLDRNERVADWPVTLVTEALKNRPDCFLSTYPDGDALYHSLSDYLQVDSDKLLLTSGIDGAIKTLCEVVTSPGDSIAVLHPTYAMYSVYARMFQLKLDLIEYTDTLEPDYRALDDCLNRGPAILFIPNPNQPIDSCLDLATLRDICASAAANGTLVAIDEAYYGFGAPTAISLIDELPNVVVMRTFSKGFGLPSIRTGVMASSLDNMAVLAKTRFAHEGNSLSYAVLEYLLDHQSLIEDYSQDVVCGRETCRDRLQSLGIQVRGSHANFLLLDLDTNARASALAAWLRDRHIYVKGPWQLPIAHCLTATMGPVLLMNPFIDAVEAFCLSQGADRPASREVA